MVFHVHVRTNRLGKCCISNVPMTDAMIVDTYINIVGEIDGGCHGDQTK